MSIHFQKMQHLRMLDNIAAEQNPNSSVQQRTNSLVKTQPAKEDDPEKKRRQQQEREEEEKKKSRNARAALLKRSGLSFSIPTASTQSMPHSLSSKSFPSPDEGNKDD